jgi:tRNA 2-selenouridine synthase SelU
LPLTTLALVKDSGCSKTLLIPQYEAILQQKRMANTQVGSWFIHASESRFAPTEGEALAVADALNKARYFVLECKDLPVANWPQATSKDL